MCLLRSWKTRFFAKKITDFLSIQIFVGSLWDVLNSFNKFLSQIVWQVQAVVVTYLVSHVKSVTIGRIFDNQVNAVFFMKNTKLVVLFLSHSWKFTGSQSTKKKKRFSSLSVTSLISNRLFVRSYFHSFNKDEVNFHHWLASVHQVV